MTEIYLIRHGEAEGNVFRRIHGQYESLLTPRGHRQVKCVQKRFENIHVDACYSSDLTRTSLTARSIYIPKRLKLRRDPRFREVGLWEWEDLPFGYLDKYEPHAMWAFNNDPMHWTAPGAETFDDYTQRFLEGMEEAARDHEGGTVAIFAHGAVIRGVLMRLFFGNDFSKLPYCDNTGVCKLTYHKGQFGYEFVNDNTHLPETLSTFALQHWWRSTGNRKDVNFHYVPYESSMALPRGVQIPEMDSRGILLAAMLHDEPVALVSLGAAEGDCGRILGMTLQEGMDGRYYGDQLLGTAFSHFRNLGCRQLAVAEGFYPDDIVIRYEFDPQTRTRSIDPFAFDWDDAENDSK